VPGEPKFRCHLVCVVWIIGIGALSGLG